MKKSSTLAIATVLLLATSGVALAEQGGTATPDADCNRVYEAKAHADKSVSSKQLARDLKMPVEKVNTCLRRLRHTGPRAATPQTGH